MSDQYQFYNMTNSMVRKFESGGSSYDLVLPFEPAYVRVCNYTKFGTDGTNAVAEWFRGMPSGDALVHVVIDNDGGSDRQSLDLVTTNGFTENNSGPGFTDTKVTLTNITTASPAVVTANSHGLSNDDRVILTKVAGDVGDEVNNKRYIVKSVTTNTFELYDEFGEPFEVVGTYGSGGQVNKIVQDGDIENAAKVYKLTLGSEIMGSDGDVLYAYAVQAQDYENLGDIG